MMGEEMPAKLNPPIKTNGSEGSAKVQLPAVVPGGAELPPALTVVVVVVVVVVVTVVPIVEVSVKVRVVV
jgi:hypothetical protein